MHNPLLDHTGLPAFSAIRPEHVEPAVDQVLADNRAAIESLATQPNPSWESLIEPLLALDDRLGRTWAPVAHLNSVLNSAELRLAYNACLPKLSRYATEIGQHEGLFRAYRAVAANAERAGLGTAQLKLLDDALRDFRLAGIELEPAQRERFKAIQEELATLTSRFEENLLDATNAWHKSVAEERALAGLPATALAQARAAAEAAGDAGWRLTLEMPAYLAVITHAEDRALREEVYRAYSTRASDQGPHAGRWDNGEVMAAVLDLRHESARLLGYASYAERSLATKMARDPAEVIAFLEDLAARSHDVAEREFAELRQFARERCGIDELAAWDVAFCAERLRLERFDIGQEQLRPYFPLPRVLAGLTAIVGRLFGVSFEAEEGVDLWHPTASFLRLRDARGGEIGGLYLDLHARAHKRSGAWMGECVQRRRAAQGLQLPVAFVVCNFPGPAGGDPALLSHEEVITLFHEFGHALHHLLTRVDYPPVGGINGVPWDAVELPSQLLENWCWEPEALALISGHYRSGEPLPAPMLERLRAARNFHCGMKMVRQLEFALFDFRLHHEHAPERGAQIYQTLEEVRERVAVVRPPAWNRFAHGFSHIFAGGYAAGYYSYKWAEVLAADAFSRFQEEGVLNAETGASFRDQVLANGGSRDPLELFVAFRGREPRIDALLHSSGIAR